MATQYNRFDASVNLKITIAIYVINICSYSYCCIGLMISAVVNDLLAVSFSAVLLTVIPSYFAGMFPAIVSKP